MKAVFFDPLSRPPNMVYRIVSVDRLVDWDPDSRTVAAVTGSTGATWHTDTAAGGWMLVDDNHPASVGTALAAVPADPVQVAVPDALVEERDWKTALQLIRRAYLRLLRRVDGHDSRLTALETAMRIAGSPVEPPPEQPRVE